MPLSHLLVYSWKILYILKPEKSSVAPLEYWARGGQAQVGETDRNMVGSWLGVTGSPLQLHDWGAPSHLSAYAEWRQGSWLPSRGSRQYVWRLLRRVPMQQAPPWDIFVRQPLGWPIGLRVSWGFQSDRKNLYTIFEKTQTIFKCAICKYPCDE